MKRIVGVGAALVDLLVNVQDSWIQENKEDILQIKTDLSLALKKISADFSVQSHFGKIWQHNIFTNLKLFSQNKNDFSKSLVICRKNSYVIGKEISLIKNQEIVEAKAIDINKDGELVVKYKSGATDNIISGEISVRIRKS